MHSRKAVVDDFIEAISEALDCDVKAKSA